MADLIAITGIAEIQQRLQAYRTEATPLMAIAVQQEADAILAASRPLVPVDTGSLRDSGQVSDPAILGPAAVIAISYGGLVGYQGRIPRQYAIVVHEDTTMRHPRGGQSHFLSEPLFAATQGMLERFAEAIHIAL